MDLLEKVWEYFSWAFVVCAFAIIPVFLICGLYDLVYPRTDVEITLSVPPNHPEYPTEHNFSLPFERSWVWTSPDSNFLDVLVHTRLRESSDRWFDEQSERYPEGIPAAVWDERPLEVLTADLVLHGEWTLMVGEPSRRWSNNSVLIVLSYVFAYFLLFGAIMGAFGFFWWVQGRGRKTS